MKKVRQSMSLIKSLNLIFILIGVPRIELGLHAPHACVLPLYYTPAQAFRAGPQMNFTINLKNLRGDKKTGRKALQASDPIVRAHKSAWHEGKISPQKGLAYFCMANRLFQRTASDKEHTSLRDCKYAHDRHNRVERDMCLFLHTAAPSFSSPFILQQNGLTSHRHWPL